MRDEYEITDSIQILIDYEYPVHVAPVVTWDINVTIIQDLIACSQHELKKQGLDHRIGEDGGTHGHLTRVVVVVGIHRAGLGPVDTHVRIEGVGRHRRKIHVNMFEVGGNHRGNRIDLRRGRSFAVGCHSKGVSA